MTPQNLLNECRNAGVKVQLEGDRIKLRGPAMAVAAVAEKLRPHKHQIIQHLLGQFHSDVQAQDVASTELDRINNMAWEFMQFDGVPYSIAIRLAADIVAHCDIAVCEAAYEDVRALCAKLLQK